MDTFSLSDFNNRWKAVAAIEREERKAETINRRWQLLNYFYNLARALELPEDDSNEETVWQRWATLKGLK
ncbi:MAG: hypothetical protein PVF74_13505 [Anaerolineales bacterium]|jgi:hypothetical protein